jgi:hypothetical protein
VQAVRAPWTTASFLLYAGGLTIALAAGGLLTTLSGDYGNAAFVGWALLVFVVLFGSAMAFRASARPLAAGLLAVGAVIAAIVFVGSLLEWFGWLSDEPISGFDVGDFVLELVAVVVSFAALRTFQFPLLVLLATTFSWVLFADILSDGGNWTAVVTFAFGLLLLMVGAAIDRIYGFWVHVVAGFLMGGAVLYFWHTGDVDWVVIGLASVIFVLVAHVLSRSSYAVLGAFGLFLVATHFISKWFLNISSLIPFFGEDTSGPRPWAAALGYAVYGLALMLLALGLERRRRGADVPPSS